ncbi:MAG: alpha/beta fold hydrolase [Pseudobdellovibrionaceae bacterium]
MAASPFFPKLPSGWTTEFIDIANKTISLRIYRSADLSQGRFLYLVHGQAEQSDRYEHFPHYLQGVVDAVICVDLPGHGKSLGVRGHIENFDEYSTAVLNGFQAAFEWMKQNSNASVQAHWFGHSLGGLITLRALLKESNLPLQSVTVSAPLLDLALPVPKLKRLFGELVEPLLGSLKLSNELNGDLISHDPEVAKAYHGNQLNHNFVTPRFFVSMMKEMPLTRNNSGPFAYNLFVIVPLADQIVSWKACLQFFKQLQMKEGKKKVLTSFPGFFHESFNELGKERAFVALSDWLNKT